MVMAKKLNFAEAKRKFGTDEEVANYFTLVEFYEKHLTGKQKEDFLSADTIDGMLNVLDANQLRHLRNLLGANLENFNRYGMAHPNDPTFENEALSEWFRDNVFENKLDIDCENLPARIYEMQRRKTNLKGLVANYKERLRKFSWNSSEYIQWLILLSVDNSIPSIDRVYDVEKLLKVLDLKQLECLKNSIEEKKTGYIVSSMEYLEPYFYWNATDGLVYGDQSLKDIMLNRVKSSFINNNEPIIDKFELEKERLIGRIKSLIDKKAAIVEDTIANLGRSKTFEDSMMKIADTMGGEDEVFLKEAIGAYSGGGHTGENLTHFYGRPYF